MIFLNPYKTANWDPGSDIVFVILNKMERYRHTGTYTIKTRFKSGFFR